MTNRSLFLISCIVIGCTAATNENVSGMNEPVPNLTLVIGGSPITSLDEPAVRAAVAAYNKRPGVGRSELPDHLNPRCVSADEAVAFVAALPRLPVLTRRSLRNETIDLASEGLKLRPMDGFGVSALGDTFRIKKKSGAWLVEPAAHVADIAAELSLAMQLIADKDARRASAQRELDAVDSSHPDYPPRFRAVAMTKQEQALAWSVALKLVRLAVEHVGSGTITVEGQAWDRARLDSEQAALQQKMRSAPAVGGMP
jgi:hypothetical protein